MSKFFSQRNLERQFLVFAVTNRLKDAQHRDRASSEPTKVTLGLTRKDYNSPNIQEAPNVVREVWPF